MLTVEIFKNALLFAGRFLFILNKHLFNLTDWIVFGFSNREKHAFIANYL